MTSAYQRIADDLRRKIQAGKLRPGDQLPSRRELSVRHQVSGGPPLDAVKLLIAEGLAETRPGAGTFVRAQPSRQRIAREWDGVPEGTTRVTETVTARPASAAEAESIGVQPGAIILVVTRECRAGGVLLDASEVLLAAERSEVAYDVRPG